MKRTRSLKRQLVKFSATVLPTMAVIFAMAACTFKMYEPELPDQLRD